MRSHLPQESTGHNLALVTLNMIRIFACLLLSCGIFLFHASALAITGATPWTNEHSFQELVYGSSSTVDVVRVMGSPPDDIVRSQQMFPPVENYYYYDENKTGAATVFVFEEGLLVGMQLKTAGNQYVDMSYFLANNGDRALNQPMLHGFYPYYPYFPIPSVTSW